MLMDPSTTSRSAILDQVRNGISVRMAVLFDLLGAPGEAVPS